MLYRECIEHVRGTSLAAETRTLACNFSNALQTLKGNSILVTDRYEYQEYKQFLKLKERWEEETMFTSSSAQLFSNSAYREIIGLGSKSIPWIIRDLKKTDSHWFFALNKITGANPILPENNGIVSKMKENWIDWAKKNNYEVE